MKTPVPHCSGTLRSKRPFEMPYFVSQLDSDWLAVSTTVRVFSSDCSWRSRCSPAALFGWHHRHDICCNTTSTTGEACCLCIVILLYPRSRPPSRLIIVVKYVDGQLETRTPQTADQRFAFARSLCLQHPNAICTCEQAEIFVHVSVRNAGLPVSRTTSMCMQWTPRCYAQEQMGLAP